MGPYPSNSERGARKSRVRLRVVSCRRRIHPVDSELPRYCQGKPSAPHCGLSNCIGAAVHRGDEPRGRLSFALGAEGAPAGAEPRSINGVQSSRHLAERHRHGSIRRVPGDPDADFTTVDRAPLPQAVVRGPTRTFVLGYARRGWAPERFSDLTLKCESIRVPQAGIAHRWACQHLAARPLGARTLSRLPPASNSGRVDREGSRQPIVAQVMDGHPYSETLIVRYLSRARDFRPSTPAES
jgi:hypothetical protein